MLAPTQESRYVHFPYCLKQLEDGRYVVLNRNYKPLGFRTSAHVRYEDYPIAVRLMGLTPRVAALLSWEGKDTLEMIFLYNDGCVPTRSAAHMTAYLKRLAVLAKLKVREDAPRRRRKGVGPAR